MSSIKLVPSPTSPVIGSTKISATNETLITTVIIATTEEVIRLGKIFCAVDFGPGDFHREPIRTARDILVVLMRFGSTPVIPTQTSSQSRRLGKHFKGLPCKNFYPIQSVTKSPPKCHDFAAFLWSQNG